MSTLLVSIVAPQGPKSLLDGAGRQPDRPGSLFPAVIPTTRDESRGPSLEVAVTVATRTSVRFFPDGHIGLFGPGDRMDAVVLDDHLDVRSGITLD